MKPMNVLRTVLLPRVFLLVLVMSVLVLTGCTLGEPVMPNPPAGLAADRSAGLVAPVPVPVPHTLDGREECFGCHAIGAVDAPPVPADHDEDVALCTTCHAVWLAPAIAAAAPPAIPHEVEGRGDCLVCHKLGTADAPRVPGNHDGLTGGICQTCHTSLEELSGSGEETGEPVAEAPLIPHPLEGFAACTLCHEEGGAGIPQFPDDHQGRSDDLCSACHSPAIEEAGEMSAVEATPTEEATADTGDAANGQVVFSTRCAACHGQDGEGTTIAPEALNDADLLAEFTDEDLTAVIRMGVEGKMPPFPDLSDQDVLDLLAFLRSWQ